VRDLVVMCAMLAFAYVALFSVFSSYLVWGWAGLIAINYYTFGFASSLPYVQIFAILTLILLVVGKDDQRVRFEGNRTATLLILFVIHGLFCAALAYPGLDRNWELYGNVAKTSLFCLLMPMLATSRYRIHALIVMIAVALSFHGVLDGLKFLANAGDYKAQVIAKFGDNNHLGLVLLMALPLMYYLYEYSNLRLVRLGFLGAIPLMVLAVVATNSRGALIGLVAIGFWLVLNSTKKIKGLLVVAVLGSMMLYLAPDSWSERMDTIGSAEQDDSFMGRVAAWKVSSAIAVEHPVFGGGFRAVQSHPVWDAFVGQPGLLGFVETPVLSRSGVAAHSIWFEVLGDTGFIGFFLFVALVANSFLTRRAVWRLVNARKGKDKWAGDLADMVGASLVAYVVSGSLLSAAYFELPYICFMLMETLKLYLLRQALPAKAVHVG
jgi:probable O-glycosylation ligase (exosortase A-associated)